MIKNFAKLKLHRPIKRQLSCYFGVISQAKKFNNSIFLAFSRYLEVNKKWN